MTDAPRRSPRAFAPDDPAIEIERADAPTPQPADGQLTDDATTFARPTFADLKRGFRWGGILVAALGAAASISAALWFHRFVSVALAREDWIGWLVAGLIGVAALALAMLVLREVVGMLRLRRLGRLKRDVAELAAKPDARAERAAVRRVMALYAGRPHLARALASLKAHARDVQDPGNLLALADRELMGTIDGEARRLVTRSAKRVATVTAMSPIASLTIGYVLIENLGLMRGLATLYGGRPGFVGSLRLARMVLAHIIATGGVALTDDLLGQFLGQDVLRRLSRRLGEGAFNGAMSARFGVAAISVIRPLPHIATQPVRARDLMGEILRRTPAEASAPTSTRPAQS